MWKLAEAACPGRSVDRGGDWDAADVGDVDVVPRVSDVSTSYMYCSPMAERIGRDRAMSIAFALLQHVKQISVSYGLHVDRAESI